MMFVWGRVKLEALLLVIVTFITGRMLPFLLIWPMTYLFDGSLYATLSIIKRLEHQWWVVVGDVVLVIMLHIFGHFTLFFHCRLGVCTMFLRRHALHELVFILLLMDSKAAALRQHIEWSVVTGSLTFELVKVFHLELGDLQYFFVFLDQMLKKISEIDGIEALFKFFDLLNLLVEMILFVFLTLVLELPVFYFNYLAVLGFQFIFKKLQLHVSVSDRRRDFLRIKRILFH